MEIVSFVKDTRQVERRSRRVLERGRETAVERAKTQRREYPRARAVGSPEQAPAVLRNSPYGREILRETEVRERDRSGGERSRAGRGPNPLLT